MHDREFETGQDDPDDIEDDGEHALRRIDNPHLAAERGEHAAGKFEALETERDADDGQAQQESTEHVTEENDKAAEYKESDIADQVHAGPVAGNWDPLL